MFDTTAHHITDIYMRIESLHPAGSFIFNSINRSCILFNNKPNIVGVYFVFKALFSAKTRADFCFESCSTYYEIMLILFILCNKEEHFLPITNTLSA